jgi:hypothetical protein
MRTWIWLLELWRLLGGLIKGLLLILFVILTLTIFVAIMVRGCHPSEHLLISAENYYGLLSEVDCQNENPGGSGLERHSPHLTY